MTPTARSLQWLKSQGWQIARTEHWNSFAKIRQDVWGFADALGCKSEHVQGVHDGFYAVGTLDEIALFQFTTTANMRAREKKIRASKEAAYWLKCGGRIYVHGWSKKGKRNQRKTWQLTEREITLDSLRNQP